jgi:hypothetical protein
MPTSREVPSSEYSSALLRGVSDGMDPAARVHAWFSGEGQHVAEMVAAKAAERGAYDLELLGRTMAGFIEVDVPVGSSEKEFYILVGILFYAEGKIARALSALKSGRLPNVDDWLDLSIYGRMARYVMQEGQWP